MTKEEKTINMFWKGIIILILIISVITLIIVVQDDVKEMIPKYNYRTQLIELDNSNTGIIDGKVVDWTCDDNVYVSRFTIRDGWFYASTWEDGKIPHSEGRCFVKIREDAEQ